MKYIKLNLPLFAADGTQGQGGEQGQSTTTKTNSNPQPTGTNKLEQFLTQSLQEKQTADFKIELAKSGLKKEYYDLFIGAKKEGGDIDLDGLKKTHSHLFNVPTNNAGDLNNFNDSATTLSQYDKIQKDLLKEVENKKVSIEK